MNKKLSSGVIKLQKISKGKLEQAKLLRKKMTHAETVLWERLKNKQLNGLKFRRQQIINGFIADFFCNELKLVIEVDGEIHNTKQQQQKDNLRKKVFESRGLKEIRFTNKEVVNHTLRVLDKIKNTSLSCGENS